MARRIASGLVATLVVCSLSFSAWAQSTRTWVSGVGDDANPCSRTAPCKTFAGAISKTATTGVISVLDPGGFGAVTITKGITLDGTGTNASILNPLTAGVIVNAPGAAVILRGIAVQGAGLGTYGVRFIGGKSLTIEDSTIIGQSGPAISFEPPTTTSSTLSVRHTTVTSNVGGGIVIAGAGTATVTVAASQFFDNDLFGLKATLTSRVSVFDSVFSGGSAKGLWAIDTAEINMDHGLISDNLVGVQGDAPIRLSDVMLGHNATGIAGTQVKSFGNNRVSSGNTTDGAPSGTIPQQ